MPLGKLLELSLIHNKKSHVLLKLSKKLQKKLLKKQEASESISLSGSLTVEAALIFPLFLFVLITLLIFQSPSDINFV